MGNADAGVDAAVEAEGGQDFGIGRDAGLEDGGRKAIEGERGVAAEIAVETARDPPESAAQNAAGEEERQAQQEGDVGELVAEFPGAEFGAGRLAGGLHDAVFGLAEEVEAALGRAG